MFEFSTKLSGGITPNPCYRIVLFFCGLAINKFKNMTSRDFAFWLQGFFEVSNAETITKEQTQLIKNHLNLVFKHEIDPSMGDDKHQAELNAIHKPNSIFPNNNDGLIRC